MRTRLLLAAAAALTLAACSDSSTTPRLSPAQVSKDELLTCRSGYHIATREDGTETCEADGTLRRSAPAAAPADSTD